jgi:hypothetical protein
MDIARPTFESPVRDAHHIRLWTPGDNQVDVVFIDEPTHIEVFSIDVEGRGEGAGTKTMLMFKDYADTNNKGLLASFVKNEAFAEHLGWLERRPVTFDGEIMLYALPEYTYGDVPVDAIDYSWMVS